MSSSLGSAFPAMKVRLVRRSQHKSGKCLTPPPGQLSTHKLKSRKVFAAPQVGGVPKITYNCSLLVWLCVLVLVCVLAVKW